MEASSRELPVINPARSRSKHRAWLLQLIRLGVLATTIYLLHQEHQAFLNQQQTRDAAPQLLDEIRRVLPMAASLGNSQPRSPELDNPPVGQSQPGELLQEIRNAMDEPIGYWLKTLPGASDIIGFSGPNDLLLVFDLQPKLLKCVLLSSGDTRDHVLEVTESSLLTSLVGRSPSELRSLADVDAISGATLTSLAMLESIRFSLRDADKPESGPPASLRFPLPPRLEVVRQLYPEVVSVKFDPEHGLWRALGSIGGHQGFFLRSTPAADNIIGYQGPTESLVKVFDDFRIGNIAVDQTYDNEPYVGYVSSDRHFRKLFDSRSLDELAKVTFEDEQIEGVSGATMTSTAVAEGILLAARVAVQERAASRQREEAKFAAQEASASQLSWPTWVSFRSTSTIGLALLGAAYGMALWKPTRRWRLVYQVLLIVWLGGINGDMLSQVLLVGWVQNDVPWARATGLVGLAAVAFLLPIATGKNTYCAHICPHGAVQQLMKNRLPWQVKLPRWLQRVFRLVPIALLLWVLCVALLPLPFSLVDIEPFDAWVWSVTGTAAVVIAVGGLVASLFVPMAYCRYGCPTGRVLEYVRFSKHGKWTHRDTAGMVLLAAAFLLIQW